MNAPLVLFVYNRPEETRKTVEALLRNKLAKHTRLYIYSDAAKAQSHVEAVDQVRRIVSDIKGFESVHIKYADQNKGLAKSIIEGVNEIILYYEKVIVLEDDLVVSSDFLEYMNDCLNLYADRKDIWSIAGYSPPIAVPSYYPNDVFLFGRASSHGWGTWLDRWKCVDWMVNDFDSFKQNKVAIQTFNKTGNDMFRLLELQKMGRMNSWAIRFCYAQFKSGSYTVYPVKSKVQINGYKENATHTGLADNRHYVDIFEGRLFPVKDVQFDEEISERFRSHQDLRPIGKAGFFLCKYNLGYKKIKTLLKKVI